MEPVTVPIATVSFQVDIEVEYNSFGGKTLDEIADGLQDELHNALAELPNVAGIFSNCTNLEFND